MPLTDNLLTEYKLQKMASSIEYDNHELNVKYFKLVKHVCTQCTPICLLLNENNYSLN